MSSGEEAVISVNKNYRGTFTNAVGTEMWVWVVLLSGSVFLFVFLIWASMRLRKRCRSRYRLSPLVSPSGQYPESTPMAS